MVALVAAGASAQAAPRLAIGPMKGEQKGALSRQLSRALCSTYECVPWAQVSRRGKLDAGLVRQEGVAGVLAGALSTKTGRVLNLDLFTRGARPAQSWRLPVNARGLVDADSLELLKRELGGRFGVAAPPPAAAAPAPAPASPPSGPRAASPVPLPPPPTAAPRTTPLPVPVARPEPEAAPAAAPAGSQWLFALQLGGFFAKRDLTYSGAGSALLEHHVPGMVGAAGRLELFPLASRATALRGLGLTVDYARSFLLETKHPTTGEKLPTTAMRFGSALTWRSPALGSLGLVVAPSAGYEARSLKVGGGGIAGLPATKLNGVRLGVGAELPLGARLGLLADLGYLYWLEAKDLVKGTPAFFNAGSAWGLEVAAGAQYRLTGAIAVRALLGYGFTNFSLSSPTGSYLASGASDAALHGSAALRLEL